MFKIACALRDVSLYCVACPEHVNLEYRLYGNISWLGYNNSGLDTKCISGLGQNIPRSGNQNCNAKFRLGASIPNNVYSIPLYSEYTILYNAYSIPLYISLHFQNRPLSVHVIPLRPFPLLLEQYIKYIVYEPWVHYIWRCKKGICGATTTKPLRPLIHTSSFYYQYIWVYRLPFVKPLYVRCVDGAHDRNFDSDVQYTKDSRYNYI